MQTLHVPEATLQRKQVLDACLDGDAWSLSIQAKAITRDEGHEGFTATLVANPRDSSKGTVITAPVTVIIRSYEEALPEVFDLSDRLFTASTQGIIKTLRHLMEVDGLADFRCLISYGGGTSDNLRRAGLVCDSWSAQVSIDGHHFSDVLLSKSPVPSDSLARCIQPTR